MAVNVLADKLVNYEVFKDGVRKLGTADVTLPELNYKTATMSGAGIAGDIEMPTPAQTESLELKLKWRTLDVNATELLALKSHDLEIRGANEVYDSATGEIIMRPVKVNVRGLPKGGSLGSFTPADHTDSENTLELVYLRVTVDGKKKVEIDKLNYIHYVNGVDYAAELREALGL